MPGPIDLPNLPEPTYYASTSFSGVGFLAPGSLLPKNATALDAAQVMPEIRIEGMAWMNEMGLS